MINPGVISLASFATFKNLNFPYRFEIEDNIGEAIHIHFKDIRLDLTVDEFMTLAQECEKIIDDLISVDGFTCKDFDPMLLTTISADLPRITKLETREVFLEDILVDTFDDDGNKIFAPIYKSRVFKALQGVEKENTEHFQTNYKSPLSTQEISNHERILYNLEQIKKYGYPHGNELIGIDHLNRIWDGQHRACCLYYLYGNIKVKVRTLYFRDNQSIEQMHSNWIDIEKELFQQSHTGKLKPFLKHSLKAVLKRVLWCSWKKADVIKAEQLSRLSQIEERLSAIEKLLSKKE